MMFARRLALVAGLVAAPSFATAQTWTTWTSLAPNDVFGTLLGISVDFQGAYAAGTQLSCCGGTDYFAPNDPYTQNGLTSPDAGGNVGFVQIVNPTTAKLFFSSPVSNLYLAFISVGQSGIGVTYSFNQAFTVLSNNNCPTAAFWGCGSYTTSGNSITGHEFSGTVQFAGTFSELDISTDPGENWHGITVGIDRVAPPVTGTPEPATIALFGTGLLALAGVKRARRPAEATRKS